MEEGFILLSSPDMPEGLGVEGGDTSACKGIADGYGHFIRQSEGKESGEDDLP